MWLLRRLGILGVAVLPLVLGQVAEAQAPRKGGVLRIGILGEPPALDAHWSTTAIVEILTNHIYEGLYTLDQDNRPIPMLAEGMPAVSRDGLVYTFKLRQGVKFHNGKELGAEDVLASLKRWGQQANTRKVLFKQVADMKASTATPSSSVSRALSPITVLALAIPNNFAAIYPKEIADKYPQQKVTEFVGTGPFRVAEWKPDQHIRMVRFDDYRAAEKPNGYGGAKSLTSTRCAGSRAGGRDARGTGGDGRARLRRRPRSTSTTAWRARPPGPSSRSRTSGSSRSSTRRKA